MCKCIRQKMGGLLHQPSQGPSPEPRQWEYSTGLHVGRKPRSSDHGFSTERSQRALMTLICDSDPGSGVASMHIFSMPAISIRPSSRRMSVLSSCGAHDDELPSLQEGRMSSKIPKTSQISLLPRNGAPFGEDIGWSSQL